MEESILITIKKLLGIAEEDTHFDHDIVLNINAALFNLNQLGIGPQTGFRINNGSEKWKDLLEERIDLEAIKTYIYLKVRLLFDPPTSSFVLESMDRQITELEWRLNVQVEGGTENG